MIVDAHIHFWRLARGDNQAVREHLAPLARDFEMAALAPALAAAGIDRIVLVQAAETLAETLYTLGTALADARIAGVVGWCDLASVALEEELRALQATGRLVGVRPVRDDNRSVRWLLDARVAAGLGLLARLGLVCDILVQNPDELPLVTTLAGRHPGLAFVLDHGGKPDIAGGRLAPWARDIAALAALPHVACKLSGLLSRASPGAGVVELAPCVDRLVAVFGPERLIWASDWPPATLAAPYERWVELTATLLDALPVAERDAVMGGNARRVYRLS